MSGVGCNLCSNVEGIRRVMVDLEAPSCCELE